MILNPRSLLVSVGAAFFICLLNGSTTLAQPPQPQPPGGLLSNMRATVKLTTVALNGGAQKPLTSLTGVPIQTPTFTVPRNPIAGTSFVFEIRTLDGRGDIKFSNTVPSGVPAGAFQWEQATLPSPNAIGKLRYTGAPNAPDSFTIHVNVRDNLDFSGAAPNGTIQINLSASGGPPQLISATATGNDVIRPTFQLAFGAGTAAQADSEVIGTYSGGLKVRLSVSNFGATTLSVVVPRFKASRNVTLALRNPFGSSTRAITLPIQPLENGPLQFDAVSNSTTSGQANIRGRFSVKHSNFGPLDASGSDDISIATVRSGDVPCNQQDVLFHVALVRWIHNDGYSGDHADQGTTTVSSHPPTDQLLRSPDNKVRISWTLKGFKGDRFYQVMFGAIDVVGVCANQIVP